MGAEENRREVWAPMTHPRVDAYSWTGVAALLILGVGVLGVLWTGAGPGACGEDLGCLLQSGNIGGILHEAVALALLLTVIAHFLIAFHNRGARPGPLLPSILAVGFVLATAVWGASLAAGALAGSLAPGILILLGAAGGAIFWGLWRNSRGEHVGAPLFGR